MFTISLLLALQNGSNNRNRVNNQSLSCKYLKVIVVAIAKVIIMARTVQFSRSVMSDSLQPHGLQHPGLPVHHQLQVLLKLTSIESVMPSNHLILCRTLLLLPSIFPSILVFPNESVLFIRWSKYWRFSYSISPSNEYSGLISFRMDWLDLLSPRDSQESSPTPPFKSINSLALSLLYGPTLP